MLLAAALAGAAGRPQVSLMTALPMAWGEGDPSDVLAGRTGRSETLKQIDKHFDVRAIDTLTRETLGQNIIVMAQPRRLTPQELVIVDDWVRRGGRAMIFADPELVWPSAYPLADRRRAPPVTLLDPLLTHWDVLLGDTDHLDHVVTFGGMSVALRAAGRWAGPKTCAGNGTFVLDCRIGKGRVVLVGDADVLDPRLWRALGADNAAWLMRALNDLNGAKMAGSTRLSGTAIAGLAVAATAILALAYRHFGGT